MREGGAWIGYPLLASGCLCQRHPDASCSFSRNLLSGWWTRRGSNPRRPRGFIDLSAATCLARERERRPHRAAFLPGSSLCLSRVEVVELVLEPETTSLDLDRFRKIEIEVGNPAVDGAVAAIVPLHDLARR